MMSLSEANVISYNTARKGSQKYSGIGIIAASECYAHLYSIILILIESSCTDYSSGEQQN